jgi:NAD(P)-dependent dehydrogenase (short-subunit alcohol dehydrogenase family)
VEIAGKGAVVTGAAAGIGRAIAGRLAQAGASVVIADIDEDYGRDAVSEIASAGGQAVFSKADVSLEEDVRRMVDLAVATYGRLDILVNNAFEGSGAHFPDAPVEQWSRVLDVVLRGTMLGIQAGLAAMNPAEGGAVLNVASIAGLGTQPHAYPEYAAAKAGVVRLTECLAPLATERNVRVNCIAPDWTATEFVRERFAAMTPAQRSVARDGFGRPAPDTFLEPAEVAGAAFDVIRDESLAGRTLVLWCGEAPRLIPEDRWE